MILGIISQCFSIICVFIFYFIHQNVLLESKKSEDTLKKDKPLITNVKKGDGKTKDTVVELDNKESVDIEVSI